MALFIYLLLNRLDLMKLLSFRLVILGVDGSIGILRVRVGMMVTTFVTIDLCLSGRTSIRHGNIIGPRACISQWAILGCILWACISIRRTAGTSCIIAWEVICWLISSSSIGLRINIIVLLYSLLLMINHLLTSLFHSSFQAVLLFVWMSWCIRNDSLDSILDIDVRSFLPYDSLIKIISVISPPSWIDERVKTRGAWFHRRVSIDNLRRNQIHAMRWWVVRCFSSSPVRRSFCNNEASLASASRENLNISSSTFSYVLSIGLCHFLCGRTLCCRIRWKIWLCLCRSELHTATCHSCRWVRVIMLLQTFLLLSFLCDLPLLLLFLLSLLKGYKQCCGFIWQHLSHRLLKGHID